MWFFVAVRILANPFSNVLQKQLARESDPLFIIAATHALLSAACLPMLAWLPRPQGGFWMQISICALLAVAGNVLIVQAVKRSDLSLLGPINAYKPVVSLIPGLLLLREAPRPVALAGIGLVVAGSAFLTERVEGGRGRGAMGRLLRDRGVQCRLAALVFSATEAVFLKRAILASSPMVTLAWWAILGWVLATGAMPLLLRRPLGEEAAMARRRAGGYLLLGMTTGLMQGATLLTFGKLQVGPALALFQLSTVLTVVLGRHYFDEQQFARRLAGAVVMAGGAILIVLGR